jgi:CRP-like cAMP-binding protein
MTLDTAVERGLQALEWKPWGMQPQESSVALYAKDAGFRKGRDCFLRGSPAELVFWLLKGFIKLYLPHDNGSRILSAITRLGEPLGMVDNVDTDGRSHQIFEAQALTKCSVGLFTRERQGWQR